MNKKQALLIHRKDHVATLLCPVAPGDRVTIIHNKSEIDQITVRETIDVYHKIAIQDIQPMQPVNKYGEVIGRAGKFIKKGQWVHVFNLESVMNHENKRL
ncbi:UxaA family hydrolase [Sporolactobacillus nakayamae]|uniref:Altronate dehydratase small subunit n=1 Tax=Sporolactobacillus nakayamae TaxID=269670 RepID=A0A1I2UP01_9BACL|nr:UxaA family hydrolase [Sporolactobacillus nakayamae]SFG78788.1 altronate dehydratase small subunit [Sporolactobacillus nakayamae]